MTVVLDSSVVVAALVDAGPTGQWAESLLLSGPLAAPQLMPVEAANVLRRTAAAGDISEDVASLAHRDLVDLPLELFPYAPRAPRVWELRSSITAYDAWYVAVAEALGATLATLDARLRRSTRPAVRSKRPRSDDGREASGGKLCKAAPRFTCSRRLRGTQTGTL